MAEEQDPEISRRYRELGTEEPPRALDEAILAAGRRGASARPASLDRAHRQRWYAPLATAAILVLAVAVTLHIREEDPEIAAPQAKKESTDAPATAEADAKLRMETELSKRADKGPERARKEPQPKPAEKAFAPDPGPAQGAAASAPQPSVVPRADDARRNVGELARQAEDRTARDAAAAARAPSYGAAESQLQKRAEAPPAAEATAPAAPPAAAAPRSKAAADMQLSSVAPTPERELERIALLRSAAQHEEADKALAEFRKRYPDYRIPEDMLRRVERR